jgi:hypothetical protein
MGSGWYSFVLSELPQMVGLTEKGMSRPTLLAFLRHYCEYAAEKSRGRRRSVPSDEVLGAIIDHLVAEGLLALHAAGSGRDDVYRWTAAGLAWLRAHGGPT